MSVIVPTRNSSRTLRDCLASIRGQSYPHVESIVVDRHSTDGTRELIEGIGVRCVTLDSERSAARNHGAKLATGAYLLFIDSDMVLQPDVVDECVAACGRGVDAVVIPELSRGQGFWAECRSLEKRCYLGDRDMESARFFRRSAFIVQGGFDESLVGGEDWDLSQRMLSAGRTLGRTESFVFHEEGHVRLSSTLQKKFYYGKSLPEYRRKHPEIARRQLTLFRPAFRRNFRMLATDPSLLFGLGCLKSMEFIAGGMGYVHGLVKGTDGRKGGGEGVGFR